MGYQQSFVKFEKEENLKRELIKYKERNTESDQAFVYGVVKTIKEISPFDLNELAIIVGGERHPQRSIYNLEEEMGISGVENIVFIDNEYYCEISDGNLGEFLDGHFESLNEGEVELLTT